MNTVFQNQAAVEAPALKGSKNKSFNIDGSKILIYIILTLWALTTIFPLLWVTGNAFKVSGDILSNSLSLPKTFTLENFRQVLNYARIDRAFMNSFIISGSVVAFSLLLGGFAAFALSRFRFKYKGIIRSYLFASMLVPQFAVLVPTFWILRDLKVYGSYFALIIPQTAANISFAVIVLMGFMVTIPRELEEAALSEGCSIPGIFFKIIFPISVPAFATTAIMIFLWSYNDLLLSLVYVPQKNLQPICVILANVSSMFGVNYGAMMAALVTTIVPVIILYACSQEYVIKGLTAGAVKG